MTASAKRLVLAWLAMAVLTLSAIVIGHAGSRQPLGPGLLVLLLSLTFVKSAVLLGNYLDLRHAPAWNKAFRLSIILLLAAIAGLSLVAALR